MPAGAKQSHWTIGGPLESINAYLSSAEKQLPADQLTYLYMDVFRNDGQVSAFLSTDPSAPLTLQEDIVHINPGK